MIATIVGRLSQAFLLLLVMSVIGFVGIHSIGNPVFNIVNAETATAEDIRNATIALGLDQPLWWQYLVFMGNVVTGRFGTSYIYHLPAFSLVMSKLPATFELATTAMLIVAPFGTLLGLHAGRRLQLPRARNRHRDQLHLLRRWRQRRAAGHEPGLASVRR